MTTKLRILSYWTLVMIGVLLLVMVLAVTPARAQDPTPPADTACFECHQSRYFLYDSGHWVCFDTMQGNCVNCHGGDANTWDKDLAHAAMIANPMQVAPAACQDCHSDAAAARLQSFSAKGSFLIKAPVAVGQLAPTPTPAPPAELAAAGVVGRVQSLAPWRQISLALIALAFVALFILGLHWWHQDQSAGHSPAAAR